MGTRLDAGTPFIQKPFTASALAAKVREVLEAPAWQPPRTDADGGPGR